jgi:alanyl-tRNA synthetase
MESQRIRRAFIEYFKKQQHAAIASSPVIPHDDPSLLFINAGMNQFKDVFLGKTEREYTRAVTSQKCIRVGGKHNDLENVGHTRRHLTFFEMLGNFSFGDYFKKEAIAFAWEVSTEVFGLDPDYIWPTVFRDDDEAFELWTAHVPAERITRFGEKDNFWAMGDTGPCGPCSELLYDRGPRYGKGRTPLEDPDGERFLEFWNLVFMQYNRNAAGEMTPLPKPCVDTGGGLERIVSLKMDVETVFGTDILHALIQEVAKASGQSYDPKNAERAPAFHVIADHLRTLSFAIADGVQPSNVDRGYVLRKVLRRAVRYGRSLGFDQPFLAQIFPKLLELMGDDYPELGQSQQRIEEILTLEEESFMRTLRRGGNILNQVMERAQRQGKVISGDDAFKLKDTYGFPLEEIQLLAKDADFGFDIERYQILEKEARERWRASRQSSNQEATENLFADFVKDKGESVFVGYDAVEAPAVITGLVCGGSFVERLEEGDEGIVLLDRTPFYAEKGGQVGDSGQLRGQEQQVFAVKDCQSPFKGVVAHHGVLKQGSLRLGQSLDALVNAGRRQLIANNHTATHLLHWALQKVLGEHVKQAGSVVDAQRLRFDFSHHKAVTAAELRQIEDLVNAEVRRNTEVGAYELSYSEAQANPDIKQFFGDKYGARVRVIDIDQSKELCGGTHTRATGNIGYFRIAKESSIAAGVRRIEAVTGTEAEQLGRKPEDELDRYAELLKTPRPKLDGRLQQLLQENKALAAELKALKAGQMEGVIQTLLGQVEEVDGKRLLMQRVDVSSKDLRDFADKAMSAFSSGALVLATTDGGKCQVLVRVSDDHVGQGVKANEMIKAIGPIIQGGGGGKANAAQAGGTAPEQLDAAFQKLRELFASA